MTLYLTSRILRLYLIHAPQRFKRCSACRLTVWLTWPWTLTKHSFDTLSIHPMPSEVGTCLQQSSYHWFWIVTIPNWASPYTLQLYLLTSQHPTSVCRTMLLSSLVLWLPSFLVASLICWQEDLLYCNWTSKLTSYFFTTEGESLISQWLWLRLDIDTK